MFSQTPNPDHTQSSDISTLTAPMMEEMGEVIIRLCDKLEPHGLVDYQMGIWEEEILSGELDLAIVTPETFCTNIACMTALTQCLDLVPRTGDSQKSSTAQKYNNTSSSHS